MIIASQKKKENIAEYLLYMWQIEDIIRAYALDIDKIKTNIVSQFDQPEQVKSEIASWYEDLIAMMRIEGVEKSGHLQINKNVIIELTDLHLQLLKSTKQAFYTAAFYKALPYIVELRAKSGENKVGEIETAFNTLYGILLLKLQGKEISESTITAVKPLQNMLMILADRYNAQKSEELEL
ncbi:MAG: DUF4924 family protein [Bacteroidales bacterium]